MNFNFILLLLLVMFSLNANANAIGGFSGSGGTSGGGGASGNWGGKSGEESCKTYIINFGYERITGSSHTQACKAFSTAWQTKWKNSNTMNYVSSTDKTCTLTTSKDGSSTSTYGISMSIKPDCQEEEKNSCEEGKKFDETLQQCIDENNNNNDDNKDNDCDPKIQQCDDEDKPKCDPCAKLDKIISNQGKQIAIAERQSQSLADILSQQRQTNQSLNNVAQKIDITNQRLDIANNNLSNINRNINNTNQKLDNTNTKLDTISSDTKQTNQKLDNIANKTDEQTGVLATIRDTLKDIKDLLNTKQENSTEPTVTPDNETLPTFDPFSAVRGFDISQNRINATKQCPADKTFQIMGATFSLPMSYLCDFLANLAPIFLALAYFKGGMIIIRGLE